MTSTIETVLFVVNASLTALAVLCAIGCYYASRAVTKRHSMSSMRVELDEIHDAIGRHSKLLQRINARTVMQERRANGGEAADTGAVPQSEGERAAWKARMRAKFITPGRPVQHK